MGWQYHKSLVYSNFRINFSKSGISYSVGVKGARKSGGPDRRFNNNRPLPICAYSQYTLKSDTRVYEVIKTCDGCFCGLYRAHQRVAIKNDY